MTTDPNKTTISRPTLRRPLRRRPEESKTTKTKFPPPVKAGEIRIIPLGGVEEIGKNMTAIEIGNDIIVIDAGLMFPDDTAPGVDYIIPDTTYLEQNKDRIRGLIVTHAHLDHIGGIPYIMSKIGNPPIYTRNLTALMIKKRQEEFSHLAPLSIIIVEKAQQLTLGQMPLRFFGVTHTIPDSMGVIVETPHGWIVNPGDFKLDLDKIDGSPTEAEEASYQIFDHNKTLLLLTDSTNIENGGFSVPEKETHKNLETIIKNATGRLFIGTFASQFERMIKIIEAAERAGKKIVVEGRSMKTNIEVATMAGLLHVNPNTIIPAQEIDQQPDNKLVILATGAQGEEFAALMRLATGTHKYLRFKKGDTVVLSSSIIPGNEITVRRLKDNIARNGVKIISYRTSDVYIHSSGHGNRGEIEWLHRKIKPKFFVPIHGNHSMLRVHADLALELGMPEKNIIVPDNGSVIEITDEGKKISLRKELAANKIVMIDGLGTNDVKEVVIRDRQMLSQDGIFVIVILIDIKTGKVKKSPDIISRGFIYLKESQDLLRHVRLLIKRRVEETTSRMHPINFDYVRNIVREEITKYLYLKTQNRPIVLPVLIEV